MRIDELARKVGIDYDHQVGADGEGYYCLCGCGEPTRWNGKRWVLFRPGHDARLLSALLRKARAGEININEAVEALEFATDSGKLASKLMSRWLRVGRTITPKIAWAQGKRIVGVNPPFNNMTLVYAPRTKYDSQPWTTGADGGFRFNHSEVRIDAIDR